MNYCHTCRRHLNGAFSCPGCGAVADRSALPDEADTTQLPPVTDEVGGAPAADLPPPAPPVTPAEGSLVDDLLRDSGLGPDAGPGHVPSGTDTGTGTTAEPAAPSAPYAPYAPDSDAGTDPGAESGTGIGGAYGQTYDDGAYGGGAYGGGAYGEDQLRDAAPADSLLGRNGGSSGSGTGDGVGGFREGHNLRRAARRRRGRHQRAAILGVGAVAVVGSLTMFGMAAFSGGTPSPSTDPGPGVSAVSPSPDPGLPSPDGTGGASPGVARSGGRTSGSASPSASGSPSASASHPHDSGAPESSSPKKPAHTVSASPSRTTDAPPSTTPPSSSTPTPTPTCTRVLWWCQ